MRALPTFLAASGVLALLGWACGGQLPGPPICSERAPCEGERRCVLGRCREPGTQPVSTRAPRLVASPEDTAWVADGAVQGRDALGPAIHLGRADDGGALYLRFSVALPAEARVQRALLVLEPMPACSLRPGKLTLEVAHVLAPWRSDDVSIGSRPELGVPMLAQETSVMPARPLRVDVTEIVKAWARHRQRYHGVALLGSGSSSTGACITTGLSHGRGPRLEVYLWPEKGEGGAGGGGGAGGSGGADAGGAGGG